MGSLAALLRSVSIPSGETVVRISLQPAEDLLVVKKTILDFK